MTNEPAATLTREDGVTAILGPGFEWSSSDAEWARSLNVAFNPLLDANAEPAGVPAYVQTVAEAAKRYKATASYPWSNSPPRDDVVY